MSTSVTGQSDDLAGPPAAEPPPHGRRLHRRRPRRRSAKRLAVEWLIVIVIAVLVAVCLRTFVVQAFYVPSASMEPTLLPHDRILVVKPSWLAGSIDRGNIVVFRHPPGGDGDCWIEPGIQDLVKRVIGLPGETISSGGPSGNTIYINGKPLSEPGWYGTPGLQVGGRPIATTKIPAGDYFVMGDNRSDSCDSRYFGVIPRSSIVGKVVALVWRNGRPTLHLF
jgi:signal peptidase I